MREDILLMQKENNRKKRGDLEWSSCQRQSECNFIGSSPDSSSPPAGVGGDSDGDDGGGKFNKGGRESVPKNNLHCLP